MLHLIIILRFLWKQFLKCIWALELCKQFQFLSSRYRSSFQILFYLPFDKSYVHTLDLKLVYMQIQLSQQRIREIFLKEVNVIIWAKCTEKFLFLVTYKVLFEINDVFYFVNIYVNKISLFGNNKLSLIPGRIPNKFITLFYIWNCNEVYFLKTNDGLDLHSKWSRVFSKLFVSCKLWKI